ncbi:MAG: ribosomal-protein-alanine N-acetyltransferase, partial [Rothia sp. (in: high G+C Gram-positive bacteria)]|nr:ribosomal-protein-alanine N-acetyltransferase [Rothia sp. (in: high G+C Gram-positive bacteria)]
RKGFEHIHTRRSYYNDGVDALIMSRNLTDNTASTAKEDRD